MIRDAFRMVASIGGVGATARGCYGAANPRSSGSASSSEDQGDWVDHQLELCRLLDGEIHGLRALQDLVDILAAREPGRESCFQDQLGNPTALGEEQRVGKDEEAWLALAAHCRERRLQFAQVTDLDELELDADHGARMCLR